MPNRLHPDRGRKAILQPEKSLKKETPATLDDEGLSVVLRGHAPLFLEMIVDHAPFSGHRRHEGHALLVLRVNLVRLQILG